VCGSGDPLLARRSLYQCSGCVSSDIRISRPADSLLLRWPTNTHRIQPPLEKKSMSGTRTLCLTESACFGLRCGPVSCLALAALHSTAGDRRRSGGWRATVGQSLTLSRSLLLAPGEKGCEVLGSASAVSSFGIGRCVSSAAVDPDWFRAMANRLLGLARDQSVCLLEMTPFARRLSQPLSPNSESSQAHRKRRGSGGPGWPTASLSDRFRGPSTRTS